MKVRVEGAPGYTDFEGELEAEYLAYSDTKVFLVSYIWEGRKEFDLFDSSHVTQVTE